MKSENVNKVEGLATLATLATNTLQSAKPDKQEATKKLQQIAQELNWPLADLLDWYKNDLADITSMELDNVRYYVKDYIELIDLCRGIGHRAEQHNIENQ